MRVITGKYKGKHFQVPHQFKARPTTDFAKENLFNVLRGYLDFEETHALDLFAGTGSITLELLSRGCPEVVCVERDRTHFAHISQMLRTLADPAATPLCGDALKYISKCTKTFQLVFADPPYTLKELSELPERIMSSTLLVPRGLFILEHGRDHDFSTRPDFLEHRSYGSVNFSFFRHP